MYIYIYLHTLYVYIYISKYVYGAHMYMSRWPSTRPQFWDIPNHQNQNFIIMHMSSRRKDAISDNRKPNPEELLQCLQPMPKPSISCGSCGQLQGRQQCNTFQSS